jgi:hypothetical protein
MNCEFKLLDWCVLLVSSPPANLSQSLRRIFSPKNERKSSNASLPKSFVQERTKERLINEEGQSFCKNENERERETKRKKFEEFE